jgi:hypothetical protein
MSEPPATAIDEPTSVVLMGRAQQGDREAFRELQRIGELRGVSFTADWSAHVLLNRLKGRASDRNLLARQGVEDDLEATIRDLSEPGDGPIERLIVGRAALAMVDARMADLEHLRAIEHYPDPRDCEPFDRRRDRAQRRLLATLKALTDIRRMGRVAVRVTRVSLTTKGGHGRRRIMKNI